MSLSLRDQITTFAEQEGLLLLGIVDLDVREDFERFRQWRSEGRSAGMRYLDKYDEVRANPKNMLPDATSIIVLGYRYGSHDKYSELRKHNRPWIAQYARHKDYHRFLRKKCLNIVGRLEQVVGAPNFAARICVDSAPILERSLAQKTSRGFIGKNTMYIHPSYGSFLLLSEIITTLPLPVDERQYVNPQLRQPGIGGCGTCTRCQSHCPTGALSEDYKIDARKCISYWTIEHRGLIPFEFWPALRHYVFGCDICQLVCPYNRSSSGQAIPVPTLTRDVDLFELATLDQQTYIARFGGTPVTRAKREGLKRNALISMAVSSDPRLGLALDLARQDENEVIRGTAAQIDQFLMSTRMTCITSSKSLGFTDNPT